MMAFVAAVPQAGAVIADLIARNMDWPGSEAIAERLRKTLPPGIDDTAPPAAPPGPDPLLVLTAARTQADIAKTGAEIAKAQARAIKDRAAATKTVAEIGKTVAETEKVQAEAEGEC